MLVVKGFCSNDLMVSNTPNTVADFGEISTQGLTYAKDVGVYSNNTHPNLTLYTFKATVSNVSTPLDGNIVEHILTVLDYAYVQGATVSAGLNNTQFATLLQTQFSGNAAGFSCGPMVISNTKAIPEWITWYNTALGDNTTNAIKIWLTDFAFRSQYDEFQIVPVKPLAVLDDFFKTPTAVALELSAINTTAYFESIQVTRNNLPETTLQSKTFNYVDPINPTNKIPVNWAVLIYGLAGNNNDSISDALVSFILANSARPRADWVTIFPDIFKRTEFILLPLWDQYAIPNRIVEVGIYSPIVNVNRTLALYKTQVPSYPEAHINLNFDILSHPYMSLQIMAVGGPDNREGISNIANVFKDYINVPTTSLDFNRMSQPTKNWVLEMNTLLLIAESMTDFSSIPVGYTRIKRDGKLYVSRSYLNVNYLVSAKQNFDTAISGV